MSIAERAKWVRPLLLAAGVFAAVHLFHFLFPALFDTWNERLNDQFLALKTSFAAFKPPYDDAIVHVDLNNTSLRALKDFHPSRAHYARAIRNLGAMQAAVQMCDFIFVGGSILIATRRFMRRCSAFQTTPIPPWPSLARSRYSPNSTGPAGRLGVAGAGCGG